MATNYQDVKRIQLAVAAELRAAVARSGLTQEAVADQAGLSRSTVSRLLKGSRSADVTQLFKIAGVVGAEPGELLDAAQREYERKKNAGANPD
ncbi:transcriptional regulator, y4mF family [Mycobacteroides abscessus subsp. bolletii]|uniref:helix-turn-helix domain-containing protein n=1 Tax=Mycobacteroides abscessus TaxID=36809 RepID=UPI0009A61AC3|nr:helix-turn-helix transcriptional regulator [Mycobacteroides abscessus]SLD50561.1 transcriptional regulator, y4mF family [Mycobacteroides abscessus subsp. bolletii]